MSPRITLLILLTSLVAGACSSSRSATNENPEGTPAAKKSGIAAGLPAGAISDSGMFVVWRAGQQVLFEVPDSLLGRDMLLIGRIAGAPEGYNAYQPAGSSINEMLVRWSRLGDRIVLRRVASTEFAADTLPIAKSVRANNIQPILAAFPVKGTASDSSAWLINVSDLYLSEQPFALPFSSTTRKRFEIKRFETDRSLIERVSSYPKNIEARYLATWSAGDPPGDPSAGSISFELTQSFYLLPKEPMKPRYEDPRIGWFSVRKLDFGTEAQRVEEVEYIARWRLEPADTAAYFRGELVDPVQPIVWYLDPATPAKWRPWVRKGVEDWNRAFEAAGFRNAVIAMDPPDDPDWAPEDSRFSTVRWVASTVRNATGPSVVDPRSGEIIESDIRFFHNHILSYRNKYILQTGAYNPGARSLMIPEEELGEMLRAVIAHEIGHALGLPHNMAASAAYPVDSLRSASFTQEMGIAASIMDYARLNYIAQPGDEGVRVIRMLGPYDLYAIEWGYRRLPGDQEPDKEVAQLDAWIRSRGDSAIYRFGGQGGWHTEDPRAQMEDLGNDPVAASTYAIENLKRVVPRLTEWARAEHEDWSELEGLYLEMLGDWRLWNMHVVNVIGGVYEENRLSTDGGAVYTPVSTESQRRAMEFLERNALGDVSYLHDTVLYARITRTAGVNHLATQQQRIISYLLDAERLDRIVENSANGVELRLSEFLAWLRRSVWSNLGNRSAIDVRRRHLQRGWAEEMTQLLRRPDGDGSPGALSEIRPLVRDQLLELRREIDRALPHPDRETGAHLRDIVARIDLALNPQRALIDE